ncbi:hypothetical protein ACEPAF_7405 [Sanghuangporus sanghuang]
MTIGLPSFYFPLHDDDKYLQSTHATPTVQNPPLSALVLFFTLQILGGHIGIPMILVTLHVKRVKRHPMLKNFLITWFIYSTSFCILLYLGKQFGREPSVGLCTVQASLIYGTAVISRYEFYCTLDSGVVNVVPAAAALLLFLVIVQTGLVVLKLYRMRKSYRTMNSSGGAPTNLIIRVGVFSIYSFLAIIGSIAFWAETGTELPYVIQASLSTAAFFIFGTQRDSSQFTAADLQHLRYTAFVDGRDLATFTILIYDYLITCERETQLVWPMSWKSPVKILYLLTRYMPFFDMTINIWHHFKPGMLIADCSFAYKSMGWAIISGFVVAEIILCLRTWAVWGRSRVVAIGLFVWCIVLLVASLIINGIFLETLGFSSMPDHIAGCFVKSGSPIIAVDWVLITVFEAGILVLMLIKAFQNYQMHGQSRLYTIVYRDGTVFYVYLFALSAMNVSVIVTLPTNLALILTNLERVIHAILTSRIIMNLRGLVFDSSDEVYGAELISRPIKFCDRFGEGSY